MEGINWWAAVAAGVASWVVGALWYSALLFGKAWQREVGLDDAQVAAGNMTVILGGSLILSVVAAMVFAMFLGAKPAFGFATGAGFAAGVFWVAASFGINYLFARRSLKLWFIDGGYHATQFTVIGAVLGLWH
ncbi:MAG: DUF1761 domain-containing protein [Steroidobacteraceae bacterium]